MLQALLDLDLLETGPLQLDAPCLYWSTEGNSRKLGLVVPLLNGKVLPWYPWNCGRYLFWCYCWPSFHVCYEWVLESIILTFPPLSLFGWCASREPLQKDCCFFVIVEKTSLKFYLLLAVLKPFIKYKLFFFNKYLVFFKVLFCFPGISGNFFQGIKTPCIVHEILLQAWSSNITIWSKFVSETSTCSKRELLTFSTAVQTLNKGPITSSNFCCSLTKLETTATTRLPVLLWNIRSLINSSIFLSRWRGTDFSTKMLSCKSFSGINLQKLSFVFLERFSGRSHLNSSCCGTVRNLLKSTYSPSLFSETSLSLSASNLRFLEDFSLAAWVAKNPDVNIPRTKRAFNVK